MGMGIVQSYARATISSNLKDDEHHHDHEKLAAVAMSGKLTGSPGNLLLRVKYANDATSYKALLAEWETIVGTKAVIRAWPQHIIYQKIAALSLEYWINDICPECGGKGHMPLSGVPSVLHDDACNACGGTGIKALVCDERLRRYIADMVDTLNSMVIHAGGEAIKKLANNMDF
jgi:hypothetical protein